MKRFLIPSISVALLLGGGLAGQAPRGPLALADTTPAPADSTPAPRPAPPAAVAVETGLRKLRLGGLVQTWYSDGSGDARGTFRVRRAEVKLTGELSANASFTLMIDPAKALALSTTSTEVDGTPVLTGGRVNQASLLLQDAYVTYGLGALSVDAGQLKLPLGLEGAQPASKLDLVEPSLFNAAGRYVGARDVGVVLRGPLARGAEFRLGLFNGAGESQNATDPDAQKLGIGRLIVRPFTGVQLGAWGAYSAAGDEGAARRRRAGAEAQLARGPVTLKAELAAGRDGEMDRRGGYAQAAVRLGRVELVGRFDEWDADLDADDAVANARERDWIAGLNWSLAAPGARLQTNLVRKTFGNVADARTLLVVNLQMAW